MFKVDPEEWRKTLWLQEAHQRRCQVQIDSRIRGNGASVHDSQVMADILDIDNSNVDTYGDSAYRSASQEQEFKEN
jgi:hypothetical protein